MPTTMEAALAFIESNVLYAPGKASNAGGVAVSGLEMSQNAQRLHWTREQVDSKLHDIMRDIHENCVAHGSEDGKKVNYLNGANRSEEHTSELQSLMRISYAVFSLTNK